MAVPIFEVSSLELTMMASQEASANVANLFEFFPCDAIVFNSRDES